MWHVWLAAAAPREICGRDIHRYYYRHALCQEAVKPQMLGCRQRDDSIDFPSVKVQSTLKKDRG